MDCKTTCFTKYFQPGVAVNFTCYGTASDTEIGIIWSIRTGGSMRFSDTKYWRHDEIHGVHNVTHRRGPLPTGREPLPAGRINVNFFLVFDASRNNSAINCTYYNMNTQAFEFRHRCYHFLLTQSTVTKESTPSTISVTKESTPSTIKRGMTLYSTAA